MPSQLGTEVKAADAGMVSFQVGPEQIAEQSSQRDKAGVVQCRLAFPQIVHEQIPDRAAQNLKSVDQFVGAALPDGAQLPQRRRRAGSETAERVQNSIEQVGRSGLRAAMFGLRFEQFDDIADGDVRDCPTFGGQNQASPVGGAGGRRCRDVGIGRTQRPQPGEALGVTTAGQNSHQVPALEGCSDQPRQ